MLLFPLFLACSNEPPGPAYFVIEPQTPTSADPLKVVMLSDAPDPEGEEVSYRYTWYRDDNREVLLTGPEVPWSQTHRDEIWRVEVVPTDGVAMGPMMSQSVVIQNAPPMVTVSILPDDPTTTDHLVASVSIIDADGDSVESPEGFRAVRADVVCAGGATRNPQVRPVLCALGGVVRLTIGKT